MASFRNNSNLNRYFSGLAKEPYHIINLTLAGVIIAVMAYSGIFSPDGDKYPVACVHEKITGQPCISCGISHSFSLIVRGRIAEAYQWNQNGMRVFLFFLSQLVFRIDFLRLSVRRPENRSQLIIYDSVASGLLFLISFWPFIMNILKGII